MHDQLLLLAAILARWRRPVSFVKALNLLYWAMCVVSYQRITVAIKQPGNVVHFLIVALFAVALVAAGAIQQEYSPNGSVQ